MSEQFTTYIECLKAFEAWCEQQEMNARDVDLRLSFLAGVEFAESPKIMILGPWFNTSQDDIPMGEVMDQPLDSGVTLHISISGPYAKAAARLISAAPELRDALEMLCNGLEWNIENHPTIMNQSDEEALCTARAIINSAGGVQS